MRILVEECSYDPSILKGVLPEVDGKPAYLVALQRPDNIFDDGSLKQTAFEDLREQVRDENESTLDLLKTAFYVTDEMPIGEDPSDMLRQMAAANPIHVPGEGACDGGVQVVSHVSGPFKSAVDASGWCPCPAEQCPNPEAVKVLVLPHTMGANLYRVIAGTLKKNQNAAQLVGLAQDAFKSVRFPSASFHVWQVEKV